MIRGRSASVTYRSLSFLLFWTEKGGKIGRCVYSERRAGFPVSCFGWDASHLNKCRSGILIRKIYPLPVLFFVAIDLDFPTCWIPTSL